jgi:hypothetical protein
MQPLTFQKTYSSAMYRLSHFLIPFFRFTLLSALLFGLMSTELKAHNPQGKAEALNTLRELLGTITTQVVIEDSEFELLTEDDKGLKIAGTASIFNVQEVVVALTFSQSLREISLDFPAGVTNQVEVSGLKISDWIPDLMKDKLDLTQILLQFYPQEENRLVLSATLTQPSGKPLVELSGFAIKEPGLTFGLARSGGVTKKILGSALLSAQLVLGELVFDFAGSADTDRNWSLEASIEELTIVPLLRNVASALGMTMPPLPEPLEKFSITETSLKLNSDRSIKLKGACDFGRAEFYFAKNTGQPSNFLFALAPNTDYKLEQLSSFLAPIDKLGLKDLALVYASNLEQVEQELDIIADMGLGSPTVKPGLTLMGGFDLPDDLPGVSEKGSVLMRANFPPGLASTPNLQAAVNFKGLQLGDNFKINEAFLQLTPADLSFGAGLSVGLKLDNNWVNFTGMGEIAAPATVGLVVFMEEGNVWNEPFGLKGVAVADLGLDFGANLATAIPTPRIGVSGSLKIGPFEGSGAGMLDVGTPQNSLISLKMNSLGLQQFLDAFSSPSVKASFNSLPSHLRNFGLKDAELTIIPKTTVMAGRTYNQGLRLAATTTIAGLGSRFDINASFDKGFSGVAAVAPIILKEGNLSIFELSGNRLSDSARMAINMTIENIVRPTTPLYLVDGKLTILGITSQTKIEVNRSGVYFFTKGKIFNKFEAFIEARGGSFNDVKGLDIRAAMKNDLIVYLNREATSAIDQATKASQDRYRNAKNSLAEAEAYLRNTQKDVDAFNAQKAKVDAAVREVNSLKSRMDAAQRACKRGDVGKCIEFGGLKTAHTTAVGVLNGYRATLDALSRAVDWSKRNIAANTVAASRIVLNEFDKATTGSMKAAKWIVDKGLGGVLDVRSAEFAGKLDLLKGGNVSMKANVKFMNEDFNASFAFSFPDPLTAAKALGNLLVNDQAPKGVAPTFGGQIVEPVYPAMNFR